MTKQNLVTVKIDGSIARICINHPPVNATSKDVRAGLLDALTKIEGCELASLACAGQTFVAGGDIREFDSPAQPPHLPEVVDALEASPVPIVALLHGTVMGAGWELAMACAFRLAKPDTIFGLPEVNLGLIPGAGGTQRTPRLVGWDLAIEMACQGKIIDAKAMLSAGGICQIVENFDTALCNLKGSERPIPVSQRPLAPLPEATQTAKAKTLQKKSRGAQAPLLNLQALTWASDPYEIGQPKERALHLERRESSESKALRHIFFAERAAQKPVKLKGAGTNPIENVTVVGGGLMGVGIAYSLANAGYQVTLIEQSTTAVQTAMERFQTLLKSAVSSARMSAERADSIQQSITCATDFKAAAASGLVIEAVFEDLGVKRDVFNKLDAVVSPDTILATNTSYLDPQDIFSGVNGLDRCLGLHFFSPAHIMKLVEVIETPKTSPQILATAFAFARSLKKTPVLSGICDGFIGNRMLSAYRRAAEYLLADGALPAQVDGAMRAFGMAMGPFEAQDMSGLQIAQANRRRQDATRPSSERYVTISDQLCDLKRLGRHVGCGWYRYNAKDRTPHIDTDVTELVFAYSKQQGLTRQSFTDTDIHEILTAALANEGARIVEEGIAERPSDIDTVKVLGYGYPRWRGGPQFYANRLGVAKIRHVLDRMDALSPQSWIRADLYS